MKSTDDFYKSKRFSDGLRKWCKDCDRDCANAWRNANRDRALANLAAWRDKNKDAELAYRRIYYAANRERLIANSVEHQRRNPEAKRARNVSWKRKNIDRNRAEARRWAAENREKSRAKARAWYMNNRGRAKANARLRESREIRAMPKWANRFFIGEIYDLAKMRTKLLGVVHHVDHIVPLISPVVCGLHVEHNLRIVTASVNRAKSNSHWPDMS